MKSHIAYRISHIAKDLFLCLLSGILLILSFPNFNIWLLAWLAFLPLLFALKGASIKKAFFLAYLCGIIFWFGSIYWLAHVTLLGLIILVLYLALYFGLFGILVRLAYLLPATCYLLFLSSTWTLLEYLRSHLLTGFPWALLGYSQYLNPGVIQIADLTGCWGVSFLVMLINVSFYSLVKNKQSAKERLKKSFIPLLCIIVTLAYGYYKLNHRPSTIGHRPSTIDHRPSTIDHRPVKISVIQGNIPQELKWASNAKEYILEQYSYLTKEAVKTGSDLIIWPEAASPALLGEDDASFAKIFALCKEINTPLLLGAVVKEKEENFNSALLLDGQGQIAGRYDKLHLVPFGEYIPLKNIFPFLETIAPIGDITSGREYTIMEIPMVRLRAPLAPSEAEVPNPNVSATLTIGTEQSSGAKSQPALSYGRPSSFSVLICFEDLFPELSRRFIKEGADFLVNITNDAWYKRTSAPYQHLQASVFRAVENRAYLVRSANTGISGFINPQGELISTVRDLSGREIFVSGYATQEMVIEKRPASFYTRYGDIFLAVSLLLSLCGIMRILKVKP